MTTRPCPQHPDRTSPRSNPRPHRYEVGNDQRGKLVLICVWCGAIAPMVSTRSL